MSTIQARRLRCEYRESPLGLDETHPRLSWLLRSVQPERRGQRQTAYRILVATTREALEREEGDLWDTGKVESDQTAQIPYSGNPLRSRMECFWKVMVWDQNDDPSTWSQPSRWTMGLLEKGDWKARLIGYDAPVQGEGDLTFGGCKWIWFPEGDPRREAPRGTRYFRRILELPSGREVSRAQFLLTADDGFVLYANGSEVGRGDGEPGGWQRSKVLDLSGRLRPGHNVLAVAASSISGPAGLVGRLRVEFAGGSSLELAVDASWKASKEEVPGWNSEKFDDAAWLSAKEIGQMGDPPWGYVEPSGLSLPPLPFLRRAFEVSKDVKRAVLYVSALGTCELRLNGQHVTEDVFVPGRSDFRSRAYYRTYEVGQLLRQGSNVLGAILGDEWYAGYCGGWNKRNFYGGEPRLLLQLHLQFADRTETVLVTDEKWKASYGPILEADFYMGETYDSRLEMSGWDQAGYDDRTWEPVQVSDDPNLSLTAHPGPPVRRAMEISPRSVEEVRPGVFVFDIGQNMIGWARLKLKAGRPGQKVVMRFSEVLNSDGTIYTANLRRARNTDTYVCRGDEEEVWEPEFTFRGFRYVEVTGYPGEPGLNAIMGVVAHSDLPMVGEFKCSNPLVNRLLQNIQWSLRGNFLEVPTDCPQRDERQGWTGDAEVFSRTASYVADVSSFMTKWLLDLNDGQREDGAYPDVAPVVGGGFGSPAWGDAGIVIPYMAYRFYGDKRLLERHYASMAKYIDYLVRNSQGLLRPAIGYGDWVPAGSDTPKDVLATAYFAYVVDLMGQMADALGRVDDAQGYRQLFEKIKDAFNRAYVSKDGRIKGDTQTCYALALHIDLLPEELRSLALDHLVEDIRSRGWHLSTGFVGTRMLLPALTRFGRTDVAYRLFLRETYPSWLYPVKHGATTIWERWDGWTEERGFQGPGMNSFNHFALGCIGEWVFDTVAGVDTEGPGFRHLIIAPHPTEEISNVEARYESISGSIECRWRTEASALRIELLIPVNTTAELHIPTESPKDVTEGGRPATEAEGVELLGKEEKEVVFDIVSGRYIFQVPKPQAGVE